MNCLSNLYFLWRYIDILSMIHVPVPLILTGVGWSLILYALLSFFSVLFCHVFIYKVVLFIIVYNDTAVHVS